MPETPKPVLFDTGAGIPIDRVGVHFHDTYGQAGIGVVGS